MQNNISLALIWILFFVALFWMMSVHMPALVLMAWFGVCVVITCGNKAPGGE